MSVYNPVDLNNCDREPIHIPGQIQSHGFLVVIDQDCIIRYHSDNIPSFIEGIDENLIGSHVNDIHPLIGQNEPKDFIVQLIIFGKNNRGFEQTNPFVTDIQGKPFYLIISPTE